MKNISLQNRKRTAEMSETVSRLNQTKKNELLALKLQSLNDEAEVSGKLMELPLSSIEPDPNQPRKSFKNIDSLAKSIQEQGLLQPIVVRAQQPGHYQIIVGERRFHAASLAGLATIPAILREEEDADTLILQLLENDQREQVSPLEEAEALQKLIQKMGLTKQAIAKELGRDAHWISMRLGLLEAHPKIKSLITDEKIADLRTLHELRKLAEEDYQLFEKVLTQMKNINGAGSYRNLIRETRQVKKNVSLDEISSMEYEEGILSLTLTGKTKSLRFKVNPAVLKYALKV